MHLVLTFVHVLVCLALMAVILMQSGKGGNIAGAFGVGGGSQTLFGGRGASTFLTKATMYLGIVFFATSLALGLMARTSGQAPRSLIQQEAKQRSSSAPAPVPVPAQGAPAPAGAPAKTTK